MNKRDALIEAHMITAAIIRQHISSAEELTEDNVDADKLEDALLELANRHDAAVRRMVTGSTPDRLP